MFQSIYVIHLLALSMTERVTVQDEVGRSPTTNPLDEGIDQYQSRG
jgi:hypothetical protein